ncbi:MAG: DUF3311 domain-containing protein [Limisphaerales bacterium]
MLRKRTKWAVWLLAPLVAVFYALHQDVWNWRRVDPLAFGFLPVGLWYHALYSCVAAVVMWLLVRFAWPEHLEEAAPEPGAAGEPRGDGVQPGGGARH